MKYLLRNFSNLKARVQNGLPHIDSIDYPFFNLVVGYILHRVEDLTALQTVIATIWCLQNKGVFLQIHMFQLLEYIYENPAKLEQCAAFLEHIQTHPELNTIQELESFLENGNYSQPKKPLNSNPTNSIDTVVIEEPGRNFQKYQREKNEINEDFDEAYQIDIEMLKKMRQDQELARQMQLEEQQNARSRPKMEQQTACQVCYVDLFEGECIPLSNCAHIFHRECLVECFKAQINENNFPLRCPNQECKAQVLESDLKVVLTQDLFKKYQQHTLKAYADMNGDTISWCPTADCGYMFFHEQGDEVRFECLECKKQYCLNCRCQWHRQMTCKEYQISNSTTDDDKKFIEFVKGKKFKQCPKCKFWVEKNHGCDHMTCKCKFEFCYKCGGVYMKCQCLQKQRRLMEQRRLKAQQRRQKKQQKLRIKSQKLQKKETKTRSQRAASRSKNKN